MAIHTEHRKHKRLGVETLAFAAFRPEFKKLVRIRNISRSGLACEYLVHKGMNQGSSESEIDIFLSDDKFYVPKLPCRVVYDTKIAKHEKIFNHTMENRRCGLKFGKLSEIQRKQLEFFIENHVMGS
jgi:c-di-GMP-binding flagellar brake protein YcgR